MMKAHFAAFAMLAGCAIAQSTTSKPPISIMFDDWWNVDYVENGCQLAVQQHMKPCAQKAEETVGEFENEVDVAFSSDSGCHGLELVHFSPEMAKYAAKNPAEPAKGKMLSAATAKWSLILDLSGYSRTQAGRGWTLVDPSNKVLSGKITTPSDLARKVCRIVKGVGGVAK
jgi:hypothetical protein